MLKFTLSVAAATTLGLALGLAWSAPERRSVDDILREFDAVKLPRGLLDEQAVVELERACRRQADLALELFEGYPRHARAAELMEIRWAYLSNTFDDESVVLREAEQVLAKPPTRALQIEAARARAHAAATGFVATLEQALEWIDAAAQLRRDDGWTAFELQSLIEQRTADAALQRELAERVLQLAGADAEQHSEARAWLRLLQQVDQPLRIELDDVATGARVSLESFHGRPLLVYARQHFTHEPLSDRELAECEARCAAISASVLDVCLGAPATPSTRAGRAITTADPTDWVGGWPYSMGVRRMPVFLLVDSRGHLAGLTHGFSTAEAALAALR